MFIGKRGRDISSLSSIGEIEQLVIKRDNEIKSFQPKHSFMLGNAFKNFPNVAINCFQIKVKSTSWGTVSSSSMLDNDFKIRSHDEFNYDSAANLFDHSQDNPLGETSSNLETDSDDDTLLEALHSRSNSDIEVEEL